jgi:hypothetical protein
MGQFQNDHGLVNHTKFGMSKPTKSNINYLHTFTVTEITTAIAKCNLED